MHPRILVLRHPVRRVWQVWEARPGCTDWTARRLAQLMVAERGEQAAPDTFGVHDWQRTFWWNWRGAPWLVEGDLPMRPGSWMLAWLAQAKIPAADYVRQVEEENAQRAEARQREVGDMHYAFAGDHYRTFRDIAEQDSLAGHRHWTSSVDIDLVSKPVEGSVP